MSPLPCAVNSNMIARLEWWDAADDVTSMKKVLADSKTGIGASAYLVVFAKQSAIMCVYLSNKLECTLPTGLSEQATYKLLDETFDLEPNLEELNASPPARWSTDGSPNDASARMQLQQHMRALKYLLYVCDPGQQPLTPQMVKVAHKLLMFGAMNKDGSDIAAGEYRHSAAHSGTGLIYPPPESIPTGVIKIVDAYNAKAKVGEPVEVAAQLLYGMVALHPFEDGNGRLCRLLAAYALMAAGEPFAVPLHNGHRKCRKHYEKVLKHADFHHNTGQLAGFILECLVYKWRNLATNMSFLSA